MANLVRLLLSALVISLDPRGGSEDPIPENCPLTFTPG